MEIKTCEEYVITKLFEAEDRIEELKDEINEMQYELNSEKMAREKAENELKAIAKFIKSRVTKQESWYSFDAIWSDEEDFNLITSIINSAE